MVARVELKRTTSIIKSSSSASSDSSGDRTTKRCFVFAMLLLSLALTVNSLWLLRPASLSIFIAQQQQSNGYAENDVASIESMQEFLDELEARTSKLEQAAQQREGKAANYHDLKNNHQSNLDAATRNTQDAEYDIAEPVEITDDHSSGLTTPISTASPYSQAWNSTARRRFAYAYVIGGCKPEDPSYRNYFNDIMISTYVQREDGSQADVVVFVQMAYASKHDTLPEEDLRLLNAMDVKIKYIPKAKDESFYRTMLDKFLILGLTQYDRVLFMDGDVLARGNMDYIFELSVQGILKENVVMAGKIEPANGGFFMVTPKEGSWDRVMKIIKDKEERGAKLPYPHWDEDVGWGQPFEDGDYYELLNRKRAAKWGFYGSFADQGLLYHWTKYEEKSVSIVFRKSVQNWSAGSDGKIHLEEELDLDAVFGDYSKGRSCFKGIMNKKPCMAPHSDFIHFTGKSKPWFTGPPNEFGEVSGETSAVHYWYYILNILDEKLKIGLDFKNWKKNHRPLLGLFPKHKDVAKTQYASRKARRYLRHMRRW